MARVAIPVPDLGLETEAMQFGAWLKEPGESVARDEDLFEVEADKATVICEAPAGGVLAEVLITAGPVKMGDVLGYIDA
jgi:pyruvate/2-oxoglutarate dehydrogenase complex dihydrolipoamide acyltransferase (E2) component